MVTAFKVFNKTYKDTMWEIEKEDLYDDFHLKMLKISKYFPTNIMKYRKMYYAKVIEYFRKLKGVERMVVYEY